MGERKIRYFWRGTRQDQKLGIKGIDPDQPEEITRLMPFEGPGEPPAGRLPNCIELSEEDLDRLNLRSLVASGKLNKVNGQSIRRSRRTEFRNY